MGESDEGMNVAVKDMKKKRLIAGHIYKGLGSIVDKMKPFYLCSRMKGFVASAILKWQVYFWEAQRDNTIRTTEVSLKPNQTAKNVRQ